jgi:nucleotide-binding universal stress UspA family protein
MFSKVCIPITNESLSIHAARAALDFAHKLNASAVFVSVYSMPIIYRSQSEDEVRAELQKNTKAFLETWIEFAQARKVPCSTLAIEARASGIAQTIAETALQEHCDLIAMGTHAYEGLNRILLGSVAEAVTRHSHLPVMLFHMGLVPTAKPFECSRILVCVDGSAATAEALDVTRALAKQLPASIEVLHVVPDVPMAFDSIMPSVDYSNLAADLLNEGKHILYNAEAKLTDISNKELVLEPTHGKRIADTILELAKKHNAELIVLGTHGYGGFERLLLGSVAQAVAHHAHVPVLLTRETNRERKLVAAQIPKEIQIAPII